MGKYDGLKLRELQKLVKERGERALGDRGDLIRKLNELDGNSVPVNSALENKFNSFMDLMKQQFNQIMSEGAPQPKMTSAEFVDTVTSAAMKKTVETSAPKPADMVKAIENINDSEDDMDEIENEEALVAEPEKKFTPVEPKVMIVNDRGEIENQKINNELPKDLLLTDYLASAGLTFKELEAAVENYKYSSPDITKKVAARQDVGLSRLDGLVKRGKEEAIKIIASGVKNQTVTDVYVADALRVAGWRTVGISGGKHKMVVG